MTFRKLKEIKIKYLEKYKFKIILECESVESVHLIECKIK